MNEQILRILNEHADHYVSGERLSQQLNCSRTAVWKHIRQLREEGYEFEAAPRLGYRLIQKPDLLNLDAVRQRLKGEELPFAIQYVKMTSSTQTDAHRLVEHGAEEGTIVIAESQTSGKGRMGRSWFSPAGKGLWMSMILKPDIPIHFAPQLTMLTTVALCRAIKSAARVEVGIKWPNDLLVNNKKVCGILLESSAEDERLKYVIAGIGISINMRKDEFPEELHSKATSLFIESGKPVSREQLLLQFLKDFHLLYKLYKLNGFGAIRTLWEDKSITLGQRIRAETGGGVLEGMAERLNEIGGLVVLMNDGSRQTIYSGDIYSQ
jgi:BirA family biotin operon repressor/biotin-[acetyl-CoA-carboxylase] ligase